MNREQLLDLIFELAINEPGLVEDIDRISFTMIGEEESSSSAGLPEIDTSLLRRQIIAEVGGAVQHGYDGWGEDRFYDSDFGVALEPALDQARTCLEQGEPKMALVILEAATEAWDAGMKGLDDYVLEFFYDWADDFTLPLAEMWAEVILSADLTPDELDDWKVGLEILAEMVFGGNALGIAVVAADQGWVYPPLVAAMGGEITERGAWGQEEEIPFFADELAKIRLRVLERQKKFQEYLNLAQAEGQFMLYLHMLVKQGSSSKAMEEAKQYLIYPTSVLALVKTLASCGEVEKAFELSQFGLKLDESKGKASLTEWLRDEARGHQRSDLALEAAQRALSERVSLANYQALQQAAGESWEKLREEALGLVAQGKSANEKVDIYLEEEMYQEAIDVVDQASWVSKIEKVIEAVNVEHPDWAFRQCRQRAESIMDAGASNRYDVAVDWLRRGRDILLFHDREKEWKDYLSGVMDKHHRKYKLMPMLRGEC